MALGLGAALLAAVVFGSSAVLQAVGSRRVETARGLDPRLYFQLLRQPAFVAAFVLNLVGFVLHLVAIRLLPLFLAQAGIAASLAVTALLAVLVFHDRLVRSEWAAVAAVCVGLALLTAAAGATGEERATAGLDLTLTVAVVVIAALGAAVSRSHGGVSTTVLSVLAGLGFATTAVAARAVPGFSLSQVLAAPAAYVLPIAGALAFLLYSIALQRGAVTAATAPMIVLQTITPAVVGVWALGDEVRSGWLAPAAVGLVLTVAGAVTLARYEAVRERDATACKG